jgi:DNA-directed RNA polymerase subunit RPC12/RpoP
MINLFKYSKSAEMIVCPNCLEEQEATPGAMSIFCKKCRTRIDLKTIRSKDTKQPTQQWKPKTKSITCPLCHSNQDVLQTALSAYCKNCNQRINVTDDPNGTPSGLNTAVNMAQQRDISCPHCGTSQKVPSTALSSFCIDCGNRINLQNYEIHGKFRGNLETKGVVYISDDGVVDGNINTGSIVIAGRFNGEIIAEEKVQMKSTAILNGKVRAPAMEAEIGSKFLGHLHIGK